MIDYFTNLILNFKIEDEFESILLPAVINFFHLSRIEHSNISGQNSIKNSIPQSLLKNYKPWTK